MKKMKLEFNKAVIFFRIRLPHKIINEKDNFNRFVQKLKDFPLINPRTGSMPIKGLLISGHYAYNKILFSEPNEIYSNEITDINDIIPVIEKENNDLVPFILKRETFQINIPIETRTLDYIGEYLTNVNRFLNEMLTELGGQNKNPRFEIHLHSGLNNDLFDWFINDILANLPPGNFKYRAIIEKSKKEGAIELPFKSTAMPGDFVDLIAKKNIKNYLNIYQDNNLLALKQVTLKELEVSLFSDDIDWFKSAFELLFKYNSSLRNNESTSSQRKHRPTIGLIDSIKAAA